MPLTPMPRPQVSIERLPTRRMSNEPRESMNCKSCRKRKVCRWTGRWLAGSPPRELTFGCRSSATGCGLLARRVRSFNVLVSTVRCQPPASISRCPLANGIPDAVPKKRGPKTDVLEALLKRVDGLEARLKDKKADADAESSENAAASAPEASSSVQSLSITTTGGSMENGQQESEDTKMFSPIPPR